MNKNPKKKPPNNHLEEFLLSEGYERIIGIDEVGRGAFAGPVYVCGYIYDLNTPILKGVHDSKLLSKKRRESLYHELKSGKFILEKFDVSDIDALGIGRAVSNLVEKIVSNFDKKSFFLIDGQFSINFSDNSRQIKHGDCLHYSISCASIIAKVQRDRYMSEIATSFPQYNFEKNVGYGTAIHRQAIERYGISSIHRKSFKPIKLILDEQASVRENNRKCGGTILTQT